MSENEHSVEKQRSVQNATRELGVSGVRIASGYVQEEFLPVLRGLKGIRVYRQMRDNDPIVGGVMFAIEMMLRSLEWQVNSVDEDEDELARITPSQDLDTSVIAPTDAESSAQWLEGALFDDMSHTWEDFISSVLTMLTYGWSWFEVTYKRRIGPMEKNPARRSVFSDGAVGIRKISIRSQDSLQRWDIDENGGIRGMFQQPPFGSGIRHIPIAKSLLFRPTNHKNSPEGRSCLRNAYRPYYFSKNIEEIEANAIDREMNGLPVIKAPNAIINGKGAEAEAAKQSYLKVVRDVKLNEQAGVLLPSDSYKDSNGDPTAYPQVSLELVASQGTRNIDTDTVIKRHQRNIALTVLAEFIMLGQESGNRALSTDKTSMFLSALKGWGESIASVVNRHLIPTLWQMNGFDPQYMPYVTPGPIERIDIDQLGTFIERVSRAGATLFPDDDLENYLREAAGLPEKSPEAMSDDEPNMGREQTTPNNDNPDLEIQ